MRSLLAIALITLSLHTIFAAEKPEWGPTGHRAVGEIAEKHLSRKARKNIEKLLDGQSLAFISTYGDEIKSDPAYDKYYTWHFVNFPFGVKYEESEKSEEGDIVMGIKHCIEILKDPESSKEEKVFSLKFLTHLVGDLHQPLHVGKAEDKGGNDIKVKWHYRNSNLHRVWDSEMIESWNMSYTELAENTKTLSREQINQLQQGSVLDWTYESQELAKTIYRSAEQEEKLGYKYSYEHFGTVLTQLQKSGIRLAKILNEVFG